MCVVYCSFLAICLILTCLVFDWTRQRELLNHGINLGTTTHINSLNKLYSFNHSKHRSSIASLHDVNAETRRHGYIRTTPSGAANLPNESVVPVDDKTTALASQKPGQDESNLVLNTDYLDDVRLVNINMTVNNILLNDIHYGIQVDQAVNVTSLMPRNTDVARLKASKTGKIPDLSSSEKNTNSCIARHHVAFVKVHKAASTSVASILQRYGYTRNLTFVLPNKKRGTTSYNYLSKPGQPLTSASVIPHSLGGHYDILWNHAIYDRVAFRNLMPPDTVYVTILREPFQQFVSAFIFYNGILPLGYNGSVQLSSLISDFLHYGVKGHLLTYFRNKQAEDLGMTPEHVLNASARSHYMQQLDGDFHLVMITEYFHESLILLRHLMCWELKDVIYLPKNENVHGRSLVFSSHDRRIHRQFAQADYDLYTFFKEKFLYTLRAQGDSFRQEVRHFEEILEQVKYYCEIQLIHTSQSFTVVGASSWNNEFLFTSYDCELISLTELDFLDRIVDGMLSKSVTQFFTLGRQNEIYNWLAKNRKWYLNGISNVLGK